ncbi:hypothetical protein LVJ82_12545 [Vitreoscilla massiliensis]|uniref:Uncharacterized protein n=1 Tax=Vitreoscilla massiliensis TaxID=1689272 RepID=A0ABY4DXP7_9NEIS|nr:hypothetical protein [Vitreoscilla massiliensis]UOO88299.1 hypothetical protein LVJ82_12545 [Vitreoscilla massiliensis]
MLINLNKSPDSEVLFCILGSKLKDNIKIFDYANLPINELKQIIETKLIRNQPVISKNDLTPDEKIAVTWSNYIKQFKGFTTNWNVFWESSERMTFFVWLCIKRKGYYDNSGRYIRPYLDIFNFPNDLHNINQRKDYIRRYLILMSFIEDIQYILNELKRDWERIAALGVDIGNIKTIDSDLEIWLWEKFQLIKMRWFRPSHNLTNIKNLPNVQGYAVASDNKNHLYNSVSRPLDRKEMLNVIQGEIDLACLDDYTNKTIKQKLSMAYSNKIFQLKKKMLSPLNTHLDEKTFKQLKQLQMLYGFNKADMLTYLISESYNLNNKGKTKN